MKSLTQTIFAAALAVVTSLTVNHASAQQSIATWWVNQQTNLPPPNPFTNNTASANVIMYPMMKGFGITEPTGTAEYGGNGGTNAGVAGSEASSISNGLYLTYAIQAAPGYTVSFSTNLLYFHNSATGPNLGELQYSTDGSNYTDISAMAYSPAHAAVTGFLTNTLTSIAALQNVPSTVTNYFRIVNWGATSSGGTWYIYDNPPAGSIAGTNGFAIFGNVAPVPPAQNVASWWVNSLTNLPPPNPFTNNTADANAIVYPMMKGFGITEPTGTAEYGGNGWTNAGIVGSEASSITNGLYVTYAIQAAPGYTISFFTNILYFHNSATGPNLGELQYSTDGSNYTDISSMVYSASHAAVTGFLTNNLSNIQALQNVPSTVTNYFRIVNWGATSSGGTWYIYDNPPAGTPAGTNGFVVIGGLNSLFGVLAPANVVVSPSTITANAGQTVSFSVSQTGSPATNFWYQLNGSTASLVPSATSSTLTFSNVLGADAGSYFVILTNSSGSATSSVVTLTLVNDPIIQLQPSSVQGLVNGDAQFGVTAFGDLPINYQWYYSDASGDLIAPVSDGTQGNNSVVSGSGSSVLNIANLQSGDLTNFVVVVTNVYGVATSSVASFLTGTNTSNPGSLPLSNGVLALWDFDGSQFTNLTVNPSAIINPAPFIGTGTASVIGTCYNPGTSPFSGATDPNDIGYDAGLGGYVFTPYGFDELSPNFSWGTEDYPAVTGTNKQNGVQFNVSTLGARNIKISYDSRVSATASEYERLQYTTNGTDWVDYPASSSFSGLYGSGNAGYYTFSYDLTGFPGVDNNTNFAIRIVTEWQSTATYQTPATMMNTNVQGANGVYATNFWVGTANSYTSGASGNVAPGTVTYDLVAITGDAITNNNAPPVISSFADTNMIDTNTLVLNFTASSAEMPASNLTFTVQSLNTVVAGVFNPTLTPNVTVTHTGSANFLLNISFNGSFIPDPIDAAPILITATDTNGESSSAWFTLTAYAINQPPTNSLTALKATNTLADTAVTIPFNVGSARDPYANLTYSVTSDNNTVVPSGNIVIGGNTGTGNPTVTITPAANQVGNALISVTVSDNDPDEPRSTTAKIAFTVRPNTNVVAIDYFNYDGSGSLDSVAANYWQHLSGVNGQLQVQNGVAAVDTADNTENLQAKLLGNPYATNSGKVLYTSFTVNMSTSELPTGNGSYFTAFNDGSGVTANVEDCLVAATNGAAPGYYRLGIANVVGATALTAQMDQQDMSPGVTYFVVTSLVLSNGYSTLWISPTNPSSASVMDTTPAATATNLYNIADFELRESSTGAAGIISVGNLIVGTTFNSVIYPPVANPDSFGVTENTANDVLTPLLNDVSGGTLSIVSVTPDSNGTATISGTDVLFTPSSGFTGTSVIEYAIEDNIGGTNSSTITVTVTNDPPLANPSYYSVTENSINNVFNPLVQDVLQTPGGSLSLVSITPGANGTATISGNQILYTPNAGYVGADSVSYTFTDNLGGTNSSIVLVTVGSVPPIALSEQFSSGHLTMSWSNPAYILQTSTNVAGPYVTIPSATSPYTIVVGTNAAGFFRLVQ